MQVQQVAFRSDDASREFVGVVRARYETDLGFRVAGKMTDRIVNAGDRVRKGDLIARAATRAHEAGDACLRTLVTNLSEHVAV